MQVVAIEMITYSDDINLGPLTKSVIDLIRFKRLIASWCNVCLLPFIFIAPCIAFLALLQPNLLSLPSQSQPSLLQHQPGLALTPQVNERVHLVPVTIIVASQFSPQVPHLPIVLIWL